MPIATDRNKHRNNYKKYYENDDKTRRYVHSPFTLEDSKIEVKCDKDGKVTLTENHDNDEYDELVVPASLIFKIAMMLEMTRSIVYVDKKDT